MVIVSERYGSWTATTGFTYVNSGNQAAAAATPLITNGDRNQYVFSGAIGLAF